MLNPPQNNSHFEHLPKQQFVTFETQRTNRNTPIEIFLSTPPPPPPPPEIATFEILITVLYG